MRDVSYVPGTLTAVAGGGCLALIEASPDSPAVARIWAQVGQCTQPDVILCGLLADGLGSVPGFVMLATGDDGTARLFCRGAVGATVYGATAYDGAPHGSSSGAGVPRRIDGAGLLTWREQVVAADVTRIVLGEPPDGGALRLPAASGVLLAGCVIVDLAASAAMSQAPRADEDGEDGEDGEDVVKTIVLYDGARHAPPRDPAGQNPAGQGTVLKDTLNQDAVPRDTVTDAAVTGVLASSASPGRPGHPNGYPDTITMTTPGSMASHGPAALAPPIPGAPQPWQAPPEPPRPGPMPQGPGFAGPPAAGPGAAPSGPAGPPPGTPLPPMPATARAPGSPVPSSPQGAPGALIDVPPWLAAPGAPTPAGGMPAWAPEPQALPQPQPQPSQPQWGEADPDGAGATLQRADLAGLVTGPPDRIGPVLPALICPAGHVNPPSGAVCRRCGASLPHDPVPVPRPVLGVLRLSLGGVITLDRGVIMGRNPRADFAGPNGEDRPHVVRLPSADGDISRNHVRVDLDGWHVLVTDLNSTNGTLVTLPGRDPQQLRPGEPVPIQPNTVVTLADGIDFRYEVTE